MLLYMKNGDKLIPAEGDPPLRDEIVKYLEGMKELELVEVIFRKPKSKKTLDQLAYIHWVFRVIAKELGETMENIKAHCKGTFGPYHTITINEDYVTKNKSFEDYNKQEMTKFIEEVIEFAQTLNIVIPTEEEWNGKIRSNNQT